MYSTLSDAIKPHAITPGRHDGPSHGYRTGNQPLILPLLSLYIHAVSKDRDSQPTAVDLTALHPNRASKVHASKLLHKRPVALRPSVEAHS